MTQRRSAQSASSRTTVRRSCGRFRHGSSDKYQKSSAGGGKLRCPRCFFCVLLQKDRPAGAAAFVCGVDDTLVAHALHGVDVRRAAVQDGIAEIMFFGDDADAALFVYWAVCGHRML